MWNMVKGIVKEGCLGKDKKTTKQDNHDTCVVSSQSAMPTRGMRIMLRRTRNNLSKDERGQSNFWSIKSFSWKWPNSRPAGDRVIASLCFNDKATASWDERTICTGGILQNEPANAIDSRKHLDKPTIVHRLKSDIFITLTVMPAANAPLGQMNHE
jgi:hypothetical protein